MILIQIELSYLKQNLSIIMKKIIADIKTKFNNIKSPKKEKKTVENKTTEEKKNYRKTTISTGNGTKIGVKTINTKDIQYAIGDGESKEFEKSKAKLEQFLYTKAKEGLTLDEIMLAANEDEAFGADLEVYYQYVGPEVELAVENIVDNNELSSISEEEIKIEEISIEVSDEINDKIDFEEEKLPEENEAIYKNLIRGILTGGIFEEFEGIKQDVNTVTQEEKKALSDKVKLVAQLCPKALSADKSTWLAIAHALKDIELYKTLRELGVDLTLKNHADESAYDLIFTAINNAPSSEFAKNVIEYELSLGNENNEFINAFFTDTEIDLKTIESKDTQALLITGVAAIKNKNLDLLAEVLEKIDVMSFRNYYFLSFILINLGGKKINDDKEFRTEILQITEENILSIKQHTIHEIEIKNNDFSEFNKTYSGGKNANMLSINNCVSMTKTSKGFIALIKKLMEYKNKTLIELISAKEDVLAFLILSKDVIEIVKDEMLDAEESMLSIILKELNKNQMLQVSEEWILKEARKNGIKIMQTVMYFIQDNKLTTENFKTLISVCYGEGENDSLDACIRRMLTVEPSPLMNLYEAGEESLYIFASNQQLFNKLLGDLDFNVEAYKKEIGL